MARVWIRFYGVSSGVILAYHSISESSWIHAVSPEAFHAQLNWLTLEFACVPLAEVQEIVDGKTTRMRRPSVAITFDDGYQDWLQYAMPALRSRNIPATFFITTRFTIVTSDPQTGLEPLRSEDVNLLAAAGFEVGSHSHTHRDLSSCSREDLREECQTSRSILQQVSGQLVTRLSYPKGRYDKRHEDVVRDAGYILACAGHGCVRAGISRYRVPRMPVTRVLPLWKFKARVYRTLVWGT